MTDEDSKDLIRKSIENEKMDLDAFVPAFYAKFFAACPDIRGLFPEDLTQQEEKLLASLTHIAEALDDSERLDAILKLQGEKHRKLEVSDDHFDGFINSFTGALSDTLGPDWNRETHKAWAGFLTEVAVKMNFMTRI
ncbi:globin domain-containing protein [Leisingera sp. JC1]|uniref:globin domain-containing protein n=1 Tax=Leisingera sp. JC1 TaxID=1855282 RepID=UPI0008031081|nr:globin domain-containing protein [Leisingera sp. JC1]OBY26479.1 flavohemoprotein [Leisingera sp. JC1]